MRLQHAQAADLNLLLALHYLLEERSITRAADRFHLSQPAMSRVLLRLRGTFGDELLVRSGKSFELTPLARRLVPQLEELLPKLESLLRAGGFDPQTATDNFRVACTDYATMVLGQALCERLFSTAPNVSLQLSAWSDEALDDCIRGRLDAVLWVNTAPKPLLHETLFEEDFVCVISADHSIGEGELTQAAYLRYPHVIVDVEHGRQTLVEDHLKQLGLDRVAGLRVPYFTAAVTCVSRTDLIATVPRRIAMRYAASGEHRIVEAPLSLPSFRYILAWHPRSTEDPAHKWLREMIAACSAAA